MKEKKRYFWGFTLPVLIPYTAFVLIPVLMSFYYSALDWNGISKSTDFIGIQNYIELFNIINDEEKRNVVTALIKEIEIYRNDESEYPLKRIGLNFPVFKDGGEVTELLWDKGNTVETVALLEKADINLKN